MWLLSCLNFCSSWNGRATGSGNPSEWVGGMEMVTDYGEWRMENGDWRALTNSDSWLTRYLENGGLSGAELRITE